MEMKIKKLLTGIIILTFMLGFGTQAFAARGLTSGDQTIYGKKTFEHETTFKGNVTIDGALEGVSQYGSVFYVHSSSGANSPGNYGETYLKPFATVDFAIGQCTANKGDIINVLAGHAETFTAADGFDVDIAGVKIVGWGNGEDMPEFTFGHADAEVAIGAANVSIENVRFVAGITSITIGISIEAAGDNFTLNNCIFPKPTTNSWEFLDSIDVADGANNIKIVNCEAYNDEGGAAPNHFINAGNGTAGPEKLQVTNCIIKGDFAVSAIWSDEPCDEAYIVGNSITNHTSGQHCIEFTDAGTGVIAHNDLFTDAESTTLDPGSMSVFGNKISIAIDNDAIPRWIMQNGLDNFLALDGATQIYPENAVDDSILAKILTKSDPADISDYDNSTDSNEAIADSLATVVSEQSGSYILVNSAVTSSSIPNNTQTAAEITGASSGGLLLINIYSNTDSTGLAGPTNFEFTVDNASGLTGAGAPIALEAAAGLGASKCWNAEDDATSHNLPLYLETGKKVFVHGDDGVGTGGGIATVTLVFQRVTDAATIAGADLP